MKKELVSSYQLLTLISLFSLTFYLILPNQTLSKQNAEAKKFPQVGQTDNSPQLDKSFGNIPVYFEENQGQFNEKVKYFARGTSGYSLFLTETEAVYVLSSSKSEVSGSRFGFDHHIENSEDQRPKAQDRKATAVFMKLVGANENPENIGLEQMPHKTNYFKGEDSNWRTEIPNFKTIRMNNVYEGIDAVWKGKAKGGVQYDFLVKPNANPNQIEWEIKGADSVRIDEKGDLLIKTELGTIRQQKPFTFQEETDGSRWEIESKFKIKSKNNQQPTINKHQISFEIGNYDRSKTLTIDPTVNLSDLAFSTFLGGTDFDEGHTIKVDQTGNVYVAGSTLSLSFPTTPGTIDTTHNGSTDAFVTKLNASGSSLVYSTFLGGTLDDFATGIAVDSSGNVFVTGYTFDQAVAFPTTTGAYDETHNGSFDAFATKLNSTGSTLVYSTLIGGSVDDVGQDIAVDNLGNAFIVGTTSSGNPNYPTTNGAFDETHNGLFDAFVTKLNATGTALVYSTFLGGSSGDQGNSIAIDLSGNAFVTGQTRDDITDYPTTVGAFDRTHNGFRDVFVTKLNIAGSALIYSTFLGGSNDDLGKAIAIDASGNAFMTGQTVNSATNFPTTSGSFDETPNGISDAYVAKLDSNGTALIYSTFLGGSLDDTGNDITVDASGEAIVTGSTQHETFPSTPNAYDQTYNDGDDVFITKLNSTGSALNYSTFIGAHADDISNGIAIDSVGNIYITGKSTDPGVFFQDYPTTPGAFQTNYSSSQDAFVTKFGNSLNAPDADFDFDGDGRTDIGIFRPAPGEWWYLRSSDSGNYAVQFGNSSDTTVPADFTGDGKTDIAFWRNGEWFILRSEDQTFFSFPFGATGDIPAPGDFDGDGVDDATVYRPSNGTWFINQSSGGTSIIGFGIPEDKPVVADYDGDGKDDIAIYRPSSSQWWLNRSTDGVLVYQFGQAGDRTVQGDHTGDGKADVAFWRPSSGEWFVIRSEDQSFYSFPFGTAGDIPAPGDYDGDGQIDATVFRPSSSTWFINGSTSGTQIIGFGLSSDIPIANSYVTQ